MRPQSEAGAPDRGPVAILAGSGDLPRLLAERLARAGLEYRVLAFRGFAERALARRADATLDLLDLSGAVACLGRWAPSAVTLAGGVSRPAPSAVFGAVSALRHHDEITRLMSRGDDNLLRGVVALLEEHGHRVVGLLDLAPDLLAGEGAFGRERPTVEDSRAIESGFALVDVLAPFDVGQGAVVESERVLAIEGPEGTDAMIRRVGGLRRRWFGRSRETRRILVKGPKVGQDLRVDLPAIGPRTVSRAAKAGLAGIAVASGLTLVIDQAETVRLADRLGLFVVGVRRAMA